MATRNSAPRGPTTVATGHFSLDMSTSRGQMDATNPTHTDATDRASPVVVTTSFGLCDATNEQTGHPALC